LKSKCFFAFSQVDALKAISKADDDIGAAVRKRAPNAPALPAPGAPPPASAPPPAAGGAAAGGPPLKLIDDPQVAKYFKMLKLHLPVPAVKQKMTAEGLDPDILDRDPESLSPNSPPPAAANAAPGGPKMLLKDDPQFAKYFKMLKMHLPPPAVKQKMTSEGLDPSVLDMDPEGPSPNQPAAAPAAAGAATVLLKDDPQFAKYFKMLKMHLPPPAVKQKMTSEGLDPSVLDMDPEGPSPNQPKAAETTAEAPAAAVAAPAAVDMSGLDMFAQIRMAKELKAARLAAGGGSTAKTLSAALKKADKVLNGPRGAREELAKLTYPDGDVRFELLVKSLEECLDAADKQRGGKFIGQLAAKRVDEISAMETSCKERALELGKEGDKIDKEIEKWARRKERAPEKEQMEKELEMKWAEANKDKNQACLMLMRSYIPSDIKDLVADSFAKKVEGTGKFYPARLSERLRTMKMLHWLVTHPADIKNANFLKGGTREAFLNLVIKTCIGLLYMYEVFLYFQNLFHSICNTLVACIY